MGINLERAWALSRFGREEKPIPAGGWNCRRFAWSGLCGCAESPSGYRITLPVGLGSAEIGCFVALGRVEGLVLWVWWLVGACRIALRGRNRPPGWGLELCKRLFCGSWEGGTVSGGRKGWCCGCSGLWRRAESPSGYRITLRRG